MAKPPEAEPEQPVLAPEGGEDGLEDKPAVAMSEGAIREKGWRIDVPYEAPDATPTGLRYAEGTAEEWVPEDGLGFNGTPADQLPEIDPDVIAALGLGEQQQPPADSEDVESPE